MSKLIRIGMLTAAAAAVAAYSSNAAAVMVETYTQVVGGQSACSTFVIAPPVLARFGAIGSGLPLGGLGPCGVAGSFNLITAPTGPLNDTTSLGPTGPITSSFGSGTFQGTASAVANFGKIGAQGMASFTGATDSNTVLGADAYGRFNEAFTFLSDASHAAGTLGFAQFSLTVDGALTFTSLGGQSSGQGRVALSYQQDAGPVFDIFSANADSGGTFASSATSDVSNFIVSTIPGVSETVSGSATINTFLLPFLYGTPFDFDLGLMVAAGPRNRSAVDANFFSTALLSGISVFDQSGARVDNFSITSGSGTFYDANGVHLTTSQPGPVPVPEPMMLSLLGFGLLAPLLWRRKQSFKR